MPRIAIVTSSPPFAEGGHLVIARSLVDALRAAGHDAAITVTPQNRFGRQGAAYLANWLKAMRDDPRFIFVASSQASKAADYLLAFSRPQATEEVGLEAVLIG